jgi:hypothetical protein
MDRAAIVACPIMVVGIVMLCGAAQPIIQRNARRFMLAPAWGKLIVSADVAFGSKAAFIRCSLHPRKLTSPSTGRTSKVRCSEKTLTHADHHTTGERPPSTLIAVPVM